MAKDAISPKLRWTVFARDGFACVYCGRSPPDVVLHCDHAKPESGGGKTSAENLVTACEACNFGKGAQPRPAASATDIKRREIAVQVGEHFSTTADAMVEAMSEQGEKLFDKGISIEAASLCLALSAIRVGAEVCQLAPLPKRISKKRFLAICAAQFDEATE